MASEYTTIRIRIADKDALDFFKEHPRETYDAVIKRLMSGVTK